MPDWLKGGMVETQSHSATVFTTVGFGVCLLVARPFFVVPFS
jgi:hypothetical protein